MERNRDQKQGTKPGLKLIQNLSWDISCLYEFGNSEPETSPQHLLRDFGLAGSLVLRPRQAPWRQQAQSLKYCLLDDGGNSAPP